jgi:hypothetical protein
LMVNDDIRAKIAGLGGMDSIVARPDLDFHRLSRLLLLRAPDNPALRISHLDLNACCVQLGWAPARRQSRAARSAGNPARHSEFSGCIIAR